jgi:hypothetical protein
MMALNDIAMANEGLAEWTSTTERKKLARQNGGGLYYGRMLMAHVYEALGIIKEIKGSPHPPPRPHVDPRLGADARGRDGGLR